MDRYMIVIPAKNRALVWKCDDGEGMKLETLQMLVGGALEPVATNLEPEWAREKDVNSIVLLVDKEGRMMGRQLAKAVKGSLKRVLACEDVPDE